MVFFMEPTTGWTLTDEHYVKNDDLNVEVYYAEEEEDTQGEETTDKSINKDYILSKTNLSYIKKNRLNSF